MSAVVGNKRGFNTFDGGNNHQTKMSRIENKIKLRVLIWSKFCGSIVGRGGEVVKQLRETHRVQLSGLNTFSAKRVISLSGTREGIIMAMRDILPVAGVDAPNSAGKVGQKLPYEVNMLVPSGHIGAVIGKSGSKIKEVMDASGARIQIYPDDLHDSTERLVAIGANSSEQVANALDMLCATLEKLPLFDDFKEYEPQEDPDVGKGSGRGAPGENIGTVIVGSGGGGGGGSSNYYPEQDPNLLSNPQIGTSGASQLVTGNHLAAAYQLSLNPQLNQLGAIGGVGNQNILNQLAAITPQVGGLNNITSNQLTPNFNIQGTPNLNIQSLGVNPQAAQAPPVIASGQQFAGQFQNQQIPNQNSGYQGYQGNQGNNTPAAPLDFLQVSSTLELTLSPEMCGALIGKGGSSIKEVKAATGVKITIEGNEKGTRGDRKVTITGKQGQIQEASQMITQNIRNYQR